MKNKLIRQTQQGFSLVELLVGMVIMVILFGGVYGILSSSVNSYLYSQKRTNEIQQARKAMQIISVDLKSADKGSVTSPAKGNTSSSITYSIDSTAYTIQLGSGTENQTVIKNSDKLTTNIVTEILFARNGSDGRLVTIKITLDDPLTTTGSYELSTIVFAPNLDE